MGECENARMHVYKACLYGHRYKQIAVTYSNVRT